MDPGVLYELPAPRRRHFALDERGIGLRATWHLDRGFANLSLWAEDRCVQTFHLTPAEVGRLIGFLAGGLADAMPEVVRPDAMPEGVRPPLVAPVPEPAPVDAGAEPVRRPVRLGHVRREVADALERTARHLR